MSPSGIRTRAVVGAVVLGTVVTAGSLLSPAALLETLESVAADPLLFGLVVAGLYLVRPLLAVPTTPLAVVVGYGYGVTVGVPVALLGVVTTVVPVFCVARWIAGVDESADGLAASLGGPLGSALARTGIAVTRYYETTGPLRGVVASRLAPIPSDVATCAAATVGAVRLRHLVVGTAIGELPWTVAAVVVGASAATVTSEGLGDLGVGLGIACLVAAIVLVAGPVYRVRRTDRRSQNAGRPTDR